jgi:hypothetical protein
MSTNTEVSGFDQYKKTCSIIFGNATQSQLRYLNASVELQQVLLTSCDSVVANQLRWLENYVKDDKVISFPIDLFLKTYTSIVSLYMKYISFCYDLTTANTESCTRELETLNHYFPGSYQR